MVPASSVRESIVLTTRRTYDWCLQQRRMYVFASKQVHMIQHNSRVAVFFYVTVSCDLSNGCSCGLVLS